MLIQIHHQNIKEPDKTEFILQMELPENHPNKALRQKFDQLWISDPPPEGHQFMVCNWESEHFIKTYA